MGELHAVFLNRPNICFILCNLLLCIHDICSFYQPLGRETS